MVVLELGAGAAVGRLLSTSAERQGFDSDIAEEGVAREGGNPGEHSGAQLEEQGHHHGAVASTTEHVHLGPGHDGPAVPSGVWLSFAVLAVAIVTVVAVTGRSRMGRGAAAFSLGVAVLACGVIFWPGVLDDVLVSHLGMMPALMAATMVGPALLVRAASLAGRIPLASIPLVGLSGAATVATITLVWHLPALHLSLMNGGSTAELTLGCGMLGGFAFWITALDPRPATAAWRRRAMLAVGVPGGLLGLALLLAPGPLTPDHGLSWLGPMADQRLGGALMMVVDLLLLVPALAAATPGVPLRGAPAVAQGQPVGDK